MKISKRLLIIELALFFMMLNVSTIYSYYFTNLSDLFLVLGGVFTLVLFVLYGRLRLSKKCTFAIFVWMIIVFFTSLANEFSASAINYILKFTIMFILLDNIIKNNDDPFYILYNVTSFITFWAFLNYFLMDIIHFNVLPSLGSYTTPWGYVYNLFLGFFMENTQRIVFFGNVIKRLHVPFSEPGVAQLFFNFTLFYLLFLNKKFGKKEKILTIISFFSVILSNSLTGFLILGVIILMYSIKKKKYILIILLSVLYILIGMIMVSEKLTSTSYTDRSGDYVKMISDSIDNLPFGIGIGNSDSLEPRINPNTGEYWENSNFCGLLSPLLYFGVFSIVYYFSVYCSIRHYSYKINRIEIICLMSIILITLLTEPLSLTSIIAYFEINGVIHYLGFHKRSFLEKIQSR